MMAEFSEVMRQWRRLCVTIEKLNPQESCDACPLRNLSKHGCDTIYDNEFAGNADWAELGRRVMAWAAAHPEPVYPTWEEWFIRTGQAMLDLNIEEPDWEATVHTKIPADIAEKLGIEPKEG